MEWLQKGGAEGGNPRFYRPPRSRRSGAAYGPDGVAAVACGTRGAARPCLGRVQLRAASAMYHASSEVAFHRATRADWWAPRDCLLLGSV